MGDSAPVSIRSFNRAFWTIITLELFERGAYYGFTAVFAFHMVYNLGFETWQTGIILTMLLGLLYVVPLIAAALAEKYTYKRMLLIAFVIIMSAYALLGTISLSALYLFDLSKGLVYAFLFLTILIFGIGGGIFKPIISASIAKITTEQQRNLAYSIYYWFINLGAFLMPLSIGVLIPEGPLYLIVFFVCGALIVINFLITFFRFKEPSEHKPKSLGDSMKNLVVALTDLRFSALIVIYSGFWFMFSMNHSYLPLFMKDFAIMPKWFTVPLLATINPGFILIIGFFVGRITQKFNSLYVLLVGIGIFSIGFLCIGLSSVLPYAPFFFVLGILIFSVGEFSTHPSFISYVSKIAPSDKVAVYMAYIFIAVALGQILGTLTGGFLYTGVAENLERPVLFWSLMVCVGVLTIFFLLIYVKYRQRLVKAPIVSDANAPPVGGPERHPFLIRSPVTMLGLAAFIPLLIVLGVSLGGSDFVRQGEEDEVRVSGFDESRFEVVALDAGSDAGSMEENSEATLSQDVVAGEGELVKSVTFTLTWTDEPDIRYIRTFENEPDQLGLEVTPPADPGDPAYVPVAQSTGLATNPKDGEGRVTLTIDFTPTSATSQNGTGAWQVVVVCGECGDFKTTTPAARYYTDTSNEYSLSVAVEVYRPIAA